MKDKTKAKSKDKANTKEKINVQDKGRLVFEPDRIKGYYVVYTADGCCLGMINQADEHDWDSATHIDNQHYFEPTFYKYFTPSYLLQISRFVRGLETKKKPKRRKPKAGVKKGNT